MATTKGRKKRKKRIQRRKQYFPQRKSVLDSRIRRDNLRRQSLMLRQVQDRRYYEPNWIDGLKDVSGRPVQYSATTHVKGTNREIRLGLSQVGFRSPESVITCKRRNQRRRALFAIRKIGKGKGARRFKRRVYTEHSKIVCSR